jgi:hypothetical protein
MAMIERAALRRLRHGCDRPGARAEAAALRAGTGWKRYWRQINQMLYYWAGAASLPRQAVHGLGSHTS